MLIEREEFCDVLIYPPAGGKLTAELCGRILEESLLRPVEGDKKLFLLDAFDGSPPLVQNKLLKVLEETPEGAYFLLGASSESPILPTVLSRVKKFDLPPFSEEEIERALERKYPGENCRRAAAASGGIFSAGESMLSNGGMSFRLAEEFLRGKNPEELCRGDIGNPREFLSALKAILRDMMFCGAGLEMKQRLNLPCVPELCEEYPTGAAIRAIELATEAEKQIAFNASAASCLYSLALFMKEEKEKWKKLS